MPWSLKSLLRPVCSCSSRREGGAGLLLPALLFQEKMGAEMEFPSARQGSESNAASPDVPERLQAIDAFG